MKTGSAICPALGLLLILFSQPARTQVYSSPEITEECGRPTSNGEYDKAIDCWKKYIRQNPQFTAAFVGLGVAFKGKRQYFNAIESFSKAIQLTPNHALALNLRGEVYATLAKRDEAIADFNKALTLNPNYVAAKNNLKLLQESKAPSITRPVHKQGEPAIATSGNALSHNEIYYVANTRPPDAYISLRTHPSSSFGQRVTTMPNGTMLRVLERRNDGWWHVRVIPSGQEGWALSGQGNRVWIECCTTPAGVIPAGRPNIAAAASPLPLVAGDPPEASNVLQALEGAFPLTKFCRKQPVHIVNFGKDEWADVTFFDTYTCMGRGESGVYTVFLKRAQADTWITKCKDQPRGDLPDHDYYFKLCGLPREVYDVLFGVQATAQPIEPHDDAKNKLEDVAAIRAEILAVLKRISEQSNIVPNAESRKTLDTIAARLSKVSDRMPLVELKTVELDAKTAAEILDEAAEFKKTSEAASERLATVAAALKDLTFDAPLIQEIKETTQLVKKAQADANLQSLKEALSKLALLSDPNKLSRLKEAKDHGFDTIEAYDQYEEEKEKLSQSGIRLKPQ